jgi:hypothetical protein
VRQATLDNIALVPASFLSEPAQKQKYTTIAKHLPRGSVLLCPPPYAKQKEALSKVAAYFREKGHLVRTLPVSAIAL